LIKSAPWLIRQESEKIDFAKNLITEVWNVVTHYSKREQVTYGDFRDASDFYAYAGERLAIASSILAKYPGNFDAISLRREVLEYRRVVYRNGGAAQQNVTDIEREHGWINLRTRPHPSNEGLAAAINEEILKRSRENN
jgi:hypothetical protein